jgi:hypothetical protein
MNALPLALSLSNSFTKVGAIAAFAAMLGIAILTLLIFTQAREIKRLREWAGRAPERAAELDQRASIEAAARSQRTGPPAPVGARVIPRKTPLVSAPVSTAVNATVAAALPATAAGSSPVSGVTPLPDAAPSPNGESVSSTEPVPANAQAESPPSSPLAPDERVDTGAVPTSAPATAAGQAAPVVLGAAASGLSGKVERTDAAAQAEAGASAPATAAAKVAARAPLPPSPSAPAPPGSPSAQRAPGGAAPAPPSPVVGSPSPAIATPRRVPSRTVGGPPASVAAAPRVSSPRKQTAGSATGAAAARVASAAPAGTGPKYFKPARSPARATLLIVGSVIVAVVLLLVVVSALKGSGSGGAPSGPTTVNTQSPNNGKSHNILVSPAATAVTVLNGTDTNGLAHHLATDLQQSGYGRAEASSAVPPGTYSTTVVEYTDGHRSEASGVAKALDVTRVQPISATTASLASSAMVVVVAGADQAALLEGAGAQGNGEAAAGSAGNGEASGGESAAGGEAGTGATGAGAGESAAGTG